MKQQLDALVNKVDRVTFAHEVHLHEQKEDDSSEMHMQDLAAPPGILKHQPETAPVGQPSALTELF